jgi:hypothetical protein
MIKAITYNEKKFVFHGQNCNGLNRFVLEVVKQYVADHNEITFSLLKLSFPDRLQDNRERRKETHPLGVFADKNKVPLKKQVRYFFEDDEQIKLKDGTVIVVCDQWGQAKNSGRDNVIPFVNYVKDELKLALVIKEGDR